MSEETKCIRIRSVNSTMKLLYGDKLTWTEKAIRLRSKLVHMELQFSDRYGSISFSATKADGCNCARFKMIQYTHAYRWSTILIPVTAEQEARLFAKACEMADIQAKDYAELRMRPDFIGCYYGPDAIKYDIAGVSLSFISKRRWWNPSNERNWCNETVGLLVMVVWPDIFIVEDEYHSSRPHVDDCTSIMYGYTSIPPHEQLPDQTHYMIRYYFDNQKDINNPTQQDIDNVIAEANRD